MTANVKYSMHSWLYNFFIQDGIFDEVHFSIIWGNKMHMACCHAKELLYYIKNLSMI